MATLVDSTADKTTHRRVISGPFYLAGGALNFIEIYGSTAWISAFVHCGLRRVCTGAFFLYVTGIYVYR